MYDHQLEAPTIHESIYIHECLLGVLGEGLQHRWCTSQHLLLALLPHYLAQRVPRGAEFP